MRALRAHVRLLGGLFDLAARTILAVSTMVCVVSLSGFAQTGPSDANQNAAQGERSGQASKRKTSSLQTKPLSFFDIAKALAKEEASHSLVASIKQRGLSESVDLDFEQVYRALGATEEILIALRGARTIPSSDPTKAELAYAEGDFRMLLEAHPEKVALHSILGCLLALEERKDDATKEFREAVTLRPELSLPHAMLGLLSGDTIGAEEEFREASRILPTSSRPHGFRAWMLEDQKRFDQAIAEMRKAVQLEPDRASVHFDFGRLLNAHGDLKGAMAEFRESLRLDPASDKNHIHAWMASSLYVDREFKEAEAEARIELQYHPDSADAKKLLSDVHLASTITGRDIADYYDLHKADFNIKETTYRIFQILVTPQKDAQILNKLKDDATDEVQAKQKTEMLLQKLAGGADFEQLAMDYSEDPKLAYGGDLGFVPQSALDRADPALREVVMRLKPEETSGIIHMTNGYRILRLMKKETPGQRELTDPEVRRAIFDTLINQATAASSNTGELGKSTNGSTTVGSKMESPPRTQGMRVANNDTTAKSEVGATRASKKSSPGKSKSVPGSRAVLISTDIDCLLKIDEEPDQNLSAAKPMTVKLEPGEHLLIASSSGGKDVWKQVIQLDKPGQKVVTIALLPIRETREQDEIAKKELENAQAQEVGEQAAAAKDKERRAKDEESRRKAAEAKRKQIVDLRSKITGLQNLIAEDQEQLEQDEESIRKAEEMCSQLQPGVPCVARMTEYVAREEVRRLKREISELKGRIRDIEAEIANVQNQ